MKPDISEFSYGFVITDELLRHLPGVCAAPVFPSLYREGQTGGGYDVMIQSGVTPLFIQFKLCDYMKRATAFESQNGLLDCPFFRMHLRPSRHSKQHQMLVDLEHSGQIVYYAAPMFHRVRELNDAFHSRNTVDRSIWLRPSTIGPLPDHKDHHISFRPNGDTYFCSTPVQLQDPIDAKSMIERLQKATLTDEKSKIEPLNQIDAVLEQMMEIASTVEPLLFPASANLISDEHLQRVHPLERLALYARRVFDSQLYLVRQSPS